MGASIIVQIKPKIYHVIDIHIGSIINNREFFIFILYSPAIRGINNVGTVKEPTIYQISIACSNSIAKKIESTAVIPSPHFV
tara:strand:+ start:286 stop:531 length:246 start_codon:yes stop_codon:yes gene_type:complete